MNAKNANLDLLNETAADSWLTAGKFAVVLGALIFVCFPLVVTGVETFYFRDFGTFGYSLAFYHRECFWRGELPLWNPYNSCGLPFLAQWNTLTLYPLALFYLIFPLSWSLGMFCLGHLFLGGMGMYFLARRWTGNALAAAAAGTMFAFNGLTWQALMWPNNSAALGWMPWVVLAMELAWREGGRRVIAAGIAGAMQMLAGAPEIILLTWFVTGVLWLVELGQRETPRARTCGRFFAALLIVTGLSAAQLLPFLDLLAHSQRGSAFGDSQWAMPPTGWANYFVPLFHTFPQKGVFSQYGQFWTESYYAGVGAMALAALALWRGRDRRTWLLAGLAAFSVVMAMGDSGVLYALLKHIAPILGFMRYPIKFVVVATFAIPLLAAQGLAWFQSLPKAQWERERENLLRLGGMVLLVIVVASIWEWIAPGEKDDRAATIENAAVRAVFLALTLVCVIGLGRAEEIKLQRLLRVGLLMLAWFDVFTHTPNLSPTVERGVYEPDSVREYFKWGDELRPGVSRAMESKNALLWITIHAVSDPVADVNGRRLGMYGDYNLLDHAAKIDGLYSLEIGEMNRLTQKIYSTTNEWPRLEDFMGVSRVSNPTNLVDWLPRSAVMPLMSAGQEPIFADDDSVLNAVLSPGFAPREQVYLEPAAQGEITAHRIQAKVERTGFTPQEWTASVQASAPAMVVFSQAWCHCWRAYVDGKPSRLWRANEAFQAVEVPAGEHTVRLVYEDNAFKAGVGISLATVAAVVMIWFILNKRWEQNKKACNAFHDRE